MVHAQQRGLITGLGGSQRRAVIPGRDLRQDLAADDRLALMDKNFLDYALHLRLHLGTVHRRYHGIPLNSHGKGNGDEEKHSRRSQ